MPLSLFQCLGDIRQHIFDKDPVPRGGIADQHVRHGADKPPVLQNWRARHECVQKGTTKFVMFFIVCAADFISMSDGTLSGRVFGIFKDAYLEPA